MTGNRPLASPQEPSSPRLIFATSATMKAAANLEARSPRPKVQAAVDARRVPRGGEACGLGR